MSFQRVWHCFALHCIWYVGIESSDKSAGQCRTELSAEQIFVHPSLLRFVPVFLSPGNFEQQTCQRLGPLTWLTQTSGNDSVIGRPDQATNCEFLLQRNHLQKYLRTRCINIHDEQHSFSVQSNKAWPPGGSGHYSYKRAVACLHGRESAISIPPAFSNPALSHVCHWLNVAVAATQ